MSSYRKLPPIANSPEARNADKRLDFDARLSRLERMLGSARIISGSVSSSGVVQAGSGFTASRTSVGHYTITFTVALPNRPAVVMTAYADASNAANHAGLVGSGDVPTTTGFHVLTTNAAATTYVDLDFEFIAVCS